jgi:hypothetical protein
MHQTIRTGTRWSYQETSTCLLFSARFTHQHADSSIPPHPNTGELYNTLASFLFVKAQKFQRIQMKALTSKRMIRVYDLDGEGRKERKK